MSTYLIDFENVKSGGLAGIEHIRKEDSVHLFWSVRENKISIEMMELIRSSESEIVMHKAVTGERDALDHQLCSYLGFLAGGKGEKDFIIVSNDKAYDHLIEFWRCMNESVHIQRVPEISKVSETLAPKAVTIVTEETSERGDRVKTEVSVVEHTVSDTFGNRNSRRRERGSKYLKGGRTGRSERKNNYSESHQEEEKTVDRVKEITEYEAEGSALIELNVQTEKALSEKLYADKETAVKVPEKKVPEDRGFSEKVSVDSVIADRISEKKVPEEIVQKEMVTADNILEKKEFEEKELTGELPEEKAVVEKETAENSTEDKISSFRKDSVAAYVVTGIKTGILVESGYTADGILDSRNSSADNADYSGKSDAGNDIAFQIEQTEHEKDEIIAPYPEKSDEEKAIAVWVEQPEDETDISNWKEKVPEEKKADNQIEEPEKEADDQKKNEAEKKNRPRTARTSGRTKRGRPPKKEQAEHTPEIRVPVAEADVIAKCGDTANAEWTGEVARLINESKDKKELYSAIVKLLGQEKGRTVYHEIKVLKS